MNMSKAGNIPDYVIKQPANQLVDVITDILNITNKGVFSPSLRQPQLSQNPKGLQLSIVNSLRLLALTLILMKCFAKLVLQHIKDHIQVSHLLAFRTNRCTVEAISTAFHKLQTDLHQNAVC